jgi:hypothetical protein
LGQLGQLDGSRVAGAHRAQPLEHVERVAQVPVGELAPGAHPFGEHPDLPERLRGGRDGR